MISISYKSKHFAIVGVFLLILIVACTSEIQPLPDDCEGAIALQVESSTQATCGQENGSIIIGSSGGTGDLTFQLNQDTPQSSNTFTNLAAGSYRVLVTDQTGCTAELSVNVQNQDGVNALINNTMSSSCDDQTGSISVTASQGQAPYEYKLNDGTFQASDSFSALGPGAYTITVRDASGCEVELQATISSDVIFSEIRSIVRSNCATSGCHDGSRFPDFRSDNNILNQAGRIQARTGNRSMPPSGNGSLSNEQIAAIACWVNDGANSN